MRIAGLHSYPLKGCRRRDHDEAVIESWGLVGDRRWMAIDEAGVGITQRQVPALARVRAVPRPGGIVLDGYDVAEPVDGPKERVWVFTSKPPVTVRLAEAAAHTRLSEILGVPARLAWLSDPQVRPVARNAEPGDRVSLADNCPLLLTNESSLAALDAGVPMTRFRPNVVVGGAEPWAEDSWVGGRLRLGGTTFRVAEACRRCAVTTIDQETGERGRGEPLRTLGRVRRVDGGLLFGVLLIPELVAGSRAVVRVGDEVARVTRDET